MEMRFGCWRPGRAFLRVSVTLWVHFSSLYLPLMIASVGWSSLSFVLVSLVAMQFFLRKGRDLGLLFPSGLTLLEFQSDTARRKRRQQWLRSIGSEPTVSLAEAVEPCPWRYLEAWHFAADSLRLQAARHRLLVWKWRSRWNLCTSALHWRNTGRHFRLLRYCGVPSQTEMNWARLRSSEWVQSSLESFVRQLPPCSSFLR